MSRLVTYVSDSPDRPLNSRGASKKAFRREFARRLQDAINDKGWNQSELARRANDAGEGRVARDDVSTYIRGKSLPGAMKAGQIASALGMDIDNLIPSVRPVDRGNPEFEIRQTGDGYVWLRVNKMLTWDQAKKIMEIIHQDEPAD